MLTWIFAVVLGSRKDFTVFHNSLNPEPALMINMRHKVCSDKNAHNIINYPCNKQKHPESGTGQYRKPREISTSG